MCTLARARYSLLSRLTRRTDGKVSARNSVEFAPIASTSTAANMAPEDRRTSHRAAEQRRRDSLKLCFEELRPLLPHIPPEEDEEAAASRRPGEGNVAGQRTAGMDPRFPNKGVSKVALLRKSNAYIAALEKRIRARDEAIRGLCERFGMTEEEVVVDDWEEVRRSLSLFWLMIAERSPRNGRGMADRAMRVTLRFRQR